MDIKQFAPAYTGRLATPSTPLVENFNPPGASVGANGRGACPVKKNADATSSRVVCRGNTVSQGGRLGYVMRVRLGMAQIDWAGGTKGHWSSCQWLMVVVI